MSARACSGRLPSGIAEMKVAAGCASDVITGTAAMFTATGMVSGLFAAAGAFTVIAAVAMVDVTGRVAGSREIVSVAGVAVALDATFNHG